MFTSCCTGNISPRLPPADIIHLNPIYLRLGNRKHSKKNKQVTVKQIKPEQQRQNSFLNNYQCDYLGLLHPSQEQNEPSPLSNSILLPHSNEQTSFLKAPNYFQCSSVKKDSRNVEESSQDNGNTKLKYSQLQEKYINVLEKTNQYLERQLSKSRSKSRVGVHSTVKKFSSQLLELKEKLNRIDLSCVKKMAKMPLKGVDTNCSQFGRFEGKQNEMALFKQLRKKID